MPTLTNHTVDIHFEDSQGEGRPVVLIHGWPLSGASWSALASALVDAGHRVITYDRRGFGRSGKPGADSSYDYDTLTGDLTALLDELELRDVTLIGFSMGGGEVARYVGTHGTDRVRALGFIAAIPPRLLKDDDHPDGALDLDTVRSFQEQIRGDREGFLDGFMTNFFSANGTLKVSEEQRQAALGLAAQADLTAAAECIASWPTDFTADLDRADVPTLVVHGDADGIVPVEYSGQRTHQQVSGSELVVVADGPHGITVSHADEVNAAVLGFLDRT